MSKWVGYFTAGIIGFMTSMILLGYFSTPKTVIEYIERHVYLTGYVVGHGIIEGWNRTITYLQAIPVKIDYAWLSPIFMILGSISATLTAIAAWQLSLQSHGFKVAVAFAGAGYGAFIAYLTHVNQAFKRARLLLLPIGIILFILALIAGLLIRLNEREARRLRALARKRRVRRLRRR